MCLCDVHGGIYTPVTFACFTETIEKAVHFARFTFLSYQWVAVKAENVYNGQA